jgi:hypothetical protein
MEPKNAYACKHKAMSHERMLRTEKKINALIQRPV